MERCAYPLRFRKDDSIPRRFKKVWLRAMGRSYGSLGWGEAGGPRGFRKILPGSAVSQFGHPFTVFYPRSPSALVLPV